MTTCLFGSNFTLTGHCWPTLERVYCAVTDVLVSGNFPTTSDASDVSAEDDANDDEYDDCREHSCQPRQLRAIQQRPQWVRYFCNLSNIGDRVRNISWQTLSITVTLTLTVTLTVTIILTLTLTYTQPSRFDGLQKY